MTDECDINKQFSEINLSDPYMSENRKMNLYSCH